MYYLGVDPLQQKTGLGAEVVREAEQWLSDRGVWKVNILVRDDNAVAIGFYERLGYSGQTVRSLGKTIKRS
jgi:ribosomal protein S18 acetylase RimI-like enzyme